MMTNGSDDITRLLSLQLEDIAGEMGHTPEEAKAIIDSADSPAESVLADLVETVSDNTILALAKSESGYSMKELAIIANELKKSLKSSGALALTDKILDSGYLYCTDDGGDDILMAAIREGNTDAVEYLIGFPFDMNHKNKDGNTVIDIIRSLIKDPPNHFIRDRINMCADMIYEKLENVPTQQFLIYLIEDSDDYPKYFGLSEIAKKNSHYDAQDKDGNTLLMLAVSNGNLSLVKSLVNFGADHSKANHSGVSALSLSKSLANDNGRGVFEDMASFLETAIETESRLNDMIYYIEKSKPMGSYWEEFINHLKSTKDMNATDADGDTVLMAAMHSMLIPMTKHLIENVGLDLSKKDKRGNTAFMIAIEKYNKSGNQDFKDLADMISAKLKIKNPKTDFDAVCNALENSGTMLLSWLSKAIRITKNINERDGNGKTALHRAIEKGNFYIFKLLIDNGADINIPSSDGKTSLQLAQESGNPEILSYFEEI